MSFANRLLPVLILVTAISTRAQSTVPTVTQQLPAQSLVAGGASVSIDLRNYFNVPGVTGQVAQFDTVLGKFNVELLASAAPQTVDNFAAYVNAGSYTNTVIHRSVALNGTTNRIVQGGGYDTGFNAIGRGSPIPLEYNLPNIRGTLAMARTSDPNSATSEWFFNVDDNTDVLGTSNGGGYAVFGRVLGTGMTVVDAISAVPSSYSIGSLTNVPLQNMQSGQTTYTVDNEIVVKSVIGAQVYPTIGYTGSVLNFSGNFTTGGAVVGSVLGSKLVLTPIAGGSTSLAVTATDTNDNTASSTFAITVAASPAFTTQPASQSVVAGQPVSFTAGVTAGTAPIFQWQLSGNNIGGISNPTSATTLTVNNAQPNYAGLYVATATNTGVTGASTPAIFGVSTTSEVIGSGSVLQPTHIQHPNGNYYDQVLLTGEAETITTPGYVVRTSFIDPNDDIVQVEFGGHGNLSLVLDGFSGPATPVNYNQSSVTYMKGRAGIVITGADETTNVSVFTVGRATAYDPTGAYNILLAPNTTTNNPANNGNSIFVGHTSTTYDGMADIAFIAISSSNGKFGGVRASNTRFGAAKGYTGIYAPGVAFTGPVYVGNIVASDAAIPVLLIGSSSDVRVTGGDLLQANNQPIKVAGITQLKFTAGVNSGGTALPEIFNQALLLQNNVNVTGQIVSY